MKSLKRSIRRHHIERLKNSRKHYYQYTNGVVQTPRQLGLVVNTAQLCSCSGCGNPRRHSWFKSECLTLQERSFLETEKWNLK